VAGSPIVLPTTVAVGDPITASNFNAIRTALSLFNTAPVWTTPTLVSGWTALGGAFQTPGYYLDAAGWVHLRGAVINSSGATKAANSIIFTLPAGYRPAAQRAWTTDKAGTTYTRVDVKSTGDVIISVVANINDFAFLDGISFYSEA
jgi:hypothetical protein